MIANIYSMFKHEHFIIKSCYINGNTTLIKKKYKIFNFSLHYNSNTSNIT